MFQVCGRTVLGCNEKTVINLPKKWKHSLSVSYVCRDQGREAREINIKRYTRLLKCGSPMILLNSRTALFGILRRCCCLIIT